MVRQWRTVLRQTSSSYASPAPDFVKIAEAYGAVGRAKKPSEVERHTQAKGETGVQDRRDQSEKVYPMVPAGKAINEMLFRPVNCPPGHAMICKSSKQGSKCKCVRVK
jgi:acetolactate synthase-1/2/3 large subunit